MADTVISGLPTKAPPLDYLIPKSLEVLPKSVKATFDGTGAGASFLPTLQVIAESGQVVGSFPVDTALAAGASADVTWFQRLKRSQAAGGLGVCGETDVTLANPGVYLAAAGSFANAVTIAGATRNTETINCTHKVTSGDYVVLLVGVGSATFTDGASLVKYMVAAAPWDNSGAFTANPAQNPSYAINNQGVSGPDLGYFGGNEADTNITTYSSAPVQSTADINPGDTFRFDMVNGGGVAGSFEVGQRVYAVVGIPAAALAAGVFGAPNIAGGSVSSNFGAAAFEYLLPSGSYTTNAPQDMAHVYGIAALGYPTSTNEPVTFTGAKSVRLSHTHVVPGGTPGADPVDFWFDTAVRMHRNSYAGSCFRILLPPSASPPFMPRWSAAGTTLQMATSS
jgi:hypothetical protein